MRLMQIIYTQWYDVNLSFCSGDLPANHEVLREVSSLCDQLPVLDNKVFEKDFCSVSTLIH